MKKFSLIAVALMFTAFSFAQNKGQWSFGAGGDFTAPDANANIGHFVMDGVMVSFDFQMGMDYEVETCCTDDGTCDMDADHAHEPAEVEGEFTWGGAIRYYAVDNMFVEAGMRMGDGDDPDTYLSGGVSLELGFDGKLWFEPMLKYNMPGLEVSPLNSNASQATLGLAWSFRYTF